MARPCSLRLTACGGPTASGLDGYACENCLAYVVRQFAEGGGHGEQRCGYCGCGPTYVGVRGAPICESCARQGLTAAQHWYTLRDKPADA